MVQHNAIVKIYALHIFITYEVSWVARQEGMESAKKIGSFPDKKKQTEGE